MTQPVPERSGRVTVGLAWASARASNVTSDVRPPRQPGLRLGVPWRLRRLWNVSRRQPNQPARASPPPLNHSGGTSRFRTARTCTRVPGTARAPNGSLCGTSAAPVDLAVTSAYGAAAAMGCSSAGWWRARDGCRAHPLRVGACDFRRALRFRRPLPVQPKSAGTAPRCFHLPSRNAQDINARVQTMCPSPGRRSIENPATAVEKVWTNGNVCGWIWKSRWKLSGQPANRGLRG